MFINDFLLLVSSFILDTLLILYALKLLSEYLKKAKQIKNTIKYKGKRVKKARNKPIMLIYGVFKTFR